MKRLLNILLLLVSLVVISACRKSDTGNVPDGMIYLNQPQIVLSETGDPAINDVDPLAYSQQVTVDLYFKDSNEKPDYMDIVIVKNGDHFNPKLLRANVSTYPTTIDIDGQLLTELFGETIVGGDRFDIGADYIKGSTTIPAFPPGGAGYGPGVSQQPGSSPAVRVNAICGFAADDFVGTYVVTKDDWGGAFGVDLEVTVTKVDETTLAIAHPGAPFNTFHIKVNPDDNTVVVEEQVVTDGGTVNPAYAGLDLVIESEGGGNSNYVNACDKIIILNLSYCLPGLGCFSFGDLVEFEKQ